MKNKLQKYYKVVLILIMIVGVLLRLIVVSSNKSFWLDEAMIYNFSTKEKAVDLITGNYYDYPEHPFINYLLLKFWAKFSIEETWLRIVPLSFGILNIVLIYIAGTLIGNHFVGLLAALFFATSSYQVAHSTEIKYYQLVLASQLISLIYVLKALKEQKLVSWVKVGILNFIAVIIDYSSIWYLLSLHLFIFGYAVVKIIIKVSRDRYQYTKNIIICSSIFLLLFLPWLLKLLSVLSQSLGRQTYLTRPTLNDVYNVLAGYYSYYGFNGLYPTNANLIYSFLAFFPIFLIYLFIFFYKQNKEKILLGIWFILPMAISFIISQYRTIFIHYNLMSVTIPLFLLLAVISSLNTRMLILNIALFFLLNTASFSSPLIYSQKQNWRDLYLDLNSKKNVVLIFSPSHLKYPFLYYQDKYSQNSKYKVIRDNDVEEYFWREGSNDYKSEEKCIVTLLTSKGEIMRNAISTYEKFRHDYIIRTKKKFKGIERDVYYECFK